MGNVKVKGNTKNKVNKAPNIKFMTFLWRLGAALEFITIPLHLASMKNRAITYEWFANLREFQYVEVVYCITSAITMLVFSILVMMNWKHQRWQDMCLGLLCFAVQIGMLIWFITA